MIEWLWLFSLGSVKNQSGITQESAVPAPSSSSFSFFPPPRSSQTLPNAPRFSAVWINASPLTVLRCCAVEGRRSFLNLQEMSRWTKYTRHKPAKQTRIYRVYLYVCIYIYTYTSHCILSWVFDFDCNMWCICAFEKSEQMTTGVSSDSAISALAAPNFLDVKTQSRAVDGIST